jgi:thiol-disulfide isomerase/thioredoxin
LVCGTFITETGDYRFLSGEIKNDSLFLSTFNGSHAFYFEAKISQDEMEGIFYSGKHYQTTWEAKKDENAQLSNPYELTKIDASQPFQFTFPDLNGNYYSFPNHLSKNKITIVTLMGSWCPNCIDEIVFLKELVTKYGKENVKVVAVCYESIEDPKKRVENIKKIMDHHQLDFTFLIAGKASKLLAHQHFPVLNHVMSFPTTIFLDRENRVREIFTGFYGPATKDYFESFKNKTFELVEEMMRE